MSYGPEYRMLRQKGVQEGEGIGGKGEVQDQLWGGFGLQVPAGQVRGRGVQEGEGIGGHEQVWERLWGGFGP